MIQRQNWVIFLTSEVRETSENSRSGDWERIYRRWRRKLFQKLVWLAFLTSPRPESTNCFDSVNLVHQPHNNCFCLRFTFICHFGLVVGIVFYFSWLNLNFRRQKLLFLSVKHQPVLAISENRHNKLMIFAKKNFTSQAL